MPYTAEKPPLRQTPDQLRARIPGWGVDADPRDRPAVPRERFDPGATGAHWVEPERQPELVPRERSVEHGQLPPVFGTTCPPRLLSGALRRLSYRRFSEARAAHWLLLMAADRVDVAESRVLSLAQGRPDRPVRETGVRAERAVAPALSSRRGRVDARHHVLDPLVVAGPWVAAAGAVWAVLRAARRRQA